MSENKEFGFLDYLNVMSIAVSLMTMKYGVEKDETASTVRDKNEKQSMDIMDRMKSRMKKQKEIMEELSDEMDNLIQVMKGENYGL